MTKYQKRPVTVEAFQWFPEETDNAPDWIYDFDFQLRKDYQGHDYLIVFDGEPVIAYPGDYVIQNENIDIEVLTPDIFEETYVKVDDNDRISLDDIGNDIHDFLHKGDKQ